MDLKDFKGVASLSCGRSHLPYEMQAITSLTLRSETAAAETSPVPVWCSACPVDPRTSTSDRRQTPSRRPSVLPRLCPPWTDTEWRGKCDVMGGKSPRVHPAHKLIVPTLVHLLLLCHRTPELCTPVTIIAHHFLYGKIPRSDGIVDHHTHRVLSPQDPLLAISREKISTPGSFS